MPHERKIVEKFPFLEDNQRYAGRTEVVHRVSTFENGNVMEFIDINLHIGERFLSLPVRELDVIIEKLKLAKARAEAELPKVAEANRRHRPQDQRPQSGGRGERSRRHRGED